jgi:hypothetical protein
MSELSIDSSRTCSVFNNGTAELSKKSVPFKILNPSRSAADLNFSIQFINPNASHCSQCISNPAVCLANPSILSNVKRVLIHKNVPYVGDPGVNSLYSSN